MKTILAALAFVTGCMVGDAGPGTGGGGGGGGGGGQPDASVAQATHDGGAGATCTGAVYDPCTTASQCSSGSCQLFQQAGFQVCTETCTPGNNATCPTQNGQPATCNNMGICKPAAANTCTR